MKGSSYAIACCVDFGQENRANNMNDAPQYVDIIFLAILAIFLIGRLLGVLGQRPGEEEEESSQTYTREAEVISLSDVQRRPERTPPREEKLVPLYEKDAAFEEETFLEGAKQAFELIVGAYASGDREALSPLLSSDVYDRFVSDIEKREADNHVLETEVIGFMSEEVENVEIKDQTAWVTVEFITEQIKVLRDETGNVLSVTPDRVETVTDAWTFSRNLKSRDPNWILVEPRSPALQET